MRPPIQRGLAHGFLALAIAASLSAATLPELFQKVKQRVSAGDWTGGMKALKELDLEAARPENDQARAALRPAAAFYRGVCLAATDRSAPFSRVGSGTGEIPAVARGDPDIRADRR